MDPHLYRYTCHGDGVFMAEDNLRPPHLEEELRANKWWLFSPKLDRKDIEFWLTAKGKELYDKSLKPLHERFLPEVRLHTRERPATGIVYEDDYQAAIRI